MTSDFAEFVHATGARLYRTAFLLTGEHHLAEDLTQTTYAKMYASWRRVERADNPVAYARTVLINSFISHRRLKRNGELPTGELPDTPTAPTTDSVTRLDLLAALRRLEPLDRAVVVARYWEDRSVRETAHDLRLTESAVRARAKRALDRLRPHVTDLAPKGTPSS